MDFFSLWTFFYKLPLPLIHAAQNLDQQKFIVISISADFCQ